jgi:hypothetical protein
MKMPYLWMAALSLFLLGSCVKDAEVVPATVRFDFTAKVGQVPLVINTGTYTNASGDDYTVGVFNYYISNIRLMRDDGVFYAEPESYHLIRHGEGQTSFELKNVPDGRYTAIRFLIGVDSLRNVSGAMAGDLDPVHSMFWDWDQGYIFFKMEGQFRTRQVPWGDYAIHIGGFTGPNACLQECTIRLPVPVQARRGKASSISFSTQADEVFVNPMEIGFDYYYDNISAETFKAISENYKDMFVVEQVRN